MAEEEQPKKGLFGRLFRKEGDAAEEPESPISEPEDSPPVAEDSAEPVLSELGAMPPEDVGPPLQNGDEPVLEELEDEDPSGDTPARRGLFSRMFGRREGGSGEEEVEDEAQAGFPPDAGGARAETEERVEPEPREEAVEEPIVVADKAPDEACFPDDEGTVSEEGESSSPGLLGRLFGRRDQEPLQERGDTEELDETAEPASAETAPEGVVEEPVPLPAETAERGDEHHDGEEPPEEPEERAVGTAVGEDGARRGLFGRLRTGLGKTRKGLVQKVDRILLGKKEIDEDTLEELEEALVTADLGVHTSLRLIEGIQEKVSRRELTSPEALREHLRNEVRSILVADEGHFELGAERPQVLMVVGVNGVGKTTTIGKIASQFRACGNKVLLAAGDTFRAAAVEQLQIWGERVGAQVVRHQDGSDPAAVAFDAVEAARARDVDLVIVDTAGRLHTKSNLMEELKKMKRVIGKAMPGAPHQVLLVLDATTGQNAINQAKIFRDAVDVDGIALTKLDGTAKGGVIVGICDELKIPVQFIGIGEQVDDLRPFDAEEFVEALF